MWFDRSLWKWLECNFRNNIYIDLIVLQQEWKDMSIWECRIVDILRKVVYGVCVDACGKLQNWPRAGTEGVSQADS